MKYFLLIVPFTLSVVVCTFLSIAVINMGDVQICPDYEECVKTYNQTLEQQKTNCYTQWDSIPIDPTWHVGDRLQLYKLVCVIYPSTDTTAKYIIRDDECKLRNNTLCYWNGIDIPHTHMGNPCMTVGMFVQHYVQGVCIVTAGLFVVTLFAMSAA